MRGFHSNLSGGLALDGVKKKLFMKLLVTQILGGGGCVSRVSTIWLSADDQPAVAPGRLTKRSKLLLGVPRRQITSESTSIFHERPTGFLSGCGDQIRNSRTPAGADVVASVKAPPNLELLKIKRRKIMRRSQGCNRGERSKFVRMMMVARLPLEPILHRCVQKTCELEYEIIKVLKGKFFRDQCVITNLFVESQYILRIVSELNS